MSTFSLKKLLWYPNLLGNFIAEPFSVRGRPRGHYEVRGCLMAGWEAVWKPNQGNPKTLVDGVDNLSDAVRACEEHYEKYGE